MDNEQREPRHLPVVATLDQLRQQIDDCTVCKARVDSYEKPPSLHRGFRSADVMVVGKGPGSSEMKKAEPFAGVSGTRLEEWLEKAGAPAGEARPQVYLTSVIKCVTRNDGDFRTMVDICLPFVHRQIRHLQPSLIITLGAHAYRNLRPNGYDASYGEARYQLIDTADYTFLTPYEHHHKLLVWPHPSGRNRLLNDPDEIRALEESFKHVRPHFNTGGHSQ